MIFPPAVSGAGAGYQIEKSLRFRANALAYLSRTMGTPTDGKKVTYRIFAKRGAISSAATQNLLGAVTGSSTTTYAQFYWSTGNVLGFQEYSGAAVQSTVTTSAVYRDPSGFYDVLLVIDSTQATAADRVKIYVNGVQQTLTVSTAMPLNYTTAVTKSGYTTTIGAVVYGGSPTQFFDGYGSEIILVDGQALTPTSFGEFDTNGVWVPKAYTGTYGANGSYLPFSDGTSLSTLTADASGNGNNWTANNISLTAGATYDWMDDTPTNNFAVSNVLDIDRANITTSNGNLTLTKATAGDSPRAASTVGVTSGKWYAELTWATMSSDAVYADYFVTGVTTKENWITTSNGYNSVNYYASDAAGGINGNKATWSGGSFSGASAYGTGYYVNGSVIGIALDLDAGTVTFYNNGVSQGAITLPTTSQPWFFYSSSDGTNNSYTAHWNFGQRPFAYTPPTGFLSLCTANLPGPAIAKPSAHFDVKLYVGNSSTQSITGLDFQPDLVWMKSRGRAVEHAWYDSVRGVQKQLESNSTGIETTETTGLTAFNSDGWTMGALDQINNTTATNAYVGWAWKANGAAVSNTAGSITSQVSANTLAGFSVVTYTGTGANATVGHGLGVAPKMIIIKGRVAQSTTPHWAVYHDTLGVNGRVWLNLNNAVGASASYWNSTAPNSSVFSLGTEGAANEATRTYVAYCFAEVPGFSKIGSYTGNGSADGPFVYCGFRPAFVMIKNANAVETWIMWDAKRDTYNNVKLQLYPNGSNAEVSDGVNNTLDFTSNGFKVRGASSVMNGSGNTIVFIAFAESPFNYSRAR